MSVPLPGPLFDTQDERAMKATDLIDQDSLRSDVPHFAAGDEVEVHVRVTEGNRERVQVFHGNVIGRSFFIYWPITDRFGWGYRR